MAFHILTVYIVNELVIWWIERDGNEFFGQGTIWHQLSTAIWFAFSMLFSRGGELHRTHSRVIGVIWLTFTRADINLFSQPYYHAVSPSTNGDSSLFVDYDKREDRG